MSTIPDRFIGGITIQREKRCNSHHIQARRPISDSYLAKETES